MPFEVVERLRIRVVFVKSSYLTHPIPIITLPSPALRRREGWGQAGRRTRTAVRHPASPGLCVGSLLHLAEHFVKVEAGGLLALRIFAEGLQELPDKGLRRHQQ